MLLLLTATAHAGQVALQWDPATQPGLAGYKVYYGESSRNYTASVNAGNKTSYTVSGLTDGKKYYFAVTAYGTTGYSQSGYSNEVSKTVGSSGGSSGSGSTTSTSSSWLKVGETSVSSNWKRVSFGQAFTDPVVVAQPLNFDTADPGVIRIRNVNATGFDIRAQAWDYLGGAPLYGTVGYLVMERGSRILSNGARVEAGRVNTNQTSGFGSVAFAKPFAIAPVVITGVTSVNEASAVVTRIRNVGTGGFQLRMQEQEANSQVHATETVSYIAWQPSSGTVQGQNFHVGRTAAVMTDKFYSLPYPKALPTVPVLLADMQSFNGAEPANLRWRNKTLTSVQVKVAEEQSKDSEMGHPAEVVGGMMFWPAY